MGFFQTWRAGNRFREIRRAIDANDPEEVERLLSAMKGDGLLDERPADLLLHACDEGGRPRCVRARDEAGNMDSNTVELSALTGVIRIWAGSGGAQIPSGFTRAGIDGTCSATIPAVCGTAAGLISFSATDEIRDMPANYGVPTNVRINGAGTKLIATDWADLLNGTINQTLRDAGVFGTTQAYWTGSDGGGAAQDTCLGWTNTGGSTGTYGISNRTNTRWLDDSTGGGSSPGGCGGTRRHLCICW